MASHKHHNGSETAGGTPQVSDRDAAACDIPYSRAQFNEGVPSPDVGNPYDDDPMGERRGYRREKQDKDV